MSRKKKRINEKNKNAMSMLNNALMNVTRFPNDATAWVDLGSIQLKKNEVSAARQSFEKALQISDDNIKAIVGLAGVEKKLGNLKESLDLLLPIKDKEADGLVVNRLLGSIYKEQRLNDKARYYLERACDFNNDDSILLWEKAGFHQQVFEYDAAKVLLQKLVKKVPTSKEAWNSLGNVNRDLGRLDDASKCYQKAMKLGESPIPFSNLLTLWHYDPSKSQNDITALAKSWQEKFSPRYVTDQHSVVREKGKTISIGMVSDGFNRHPVGKMIIKCLEHIDKNDIVFHLYSTRSSEDDIKKRLVACAESYTEIKNFSDEGLIEKIQEDKVDVLFDLSGHNNGTRMYAIAHKPAPVVVKWVGGLINTTGVKTIDYLLSDAVETPDGVDDQYVEKLIRMPDDYVVFDPPNNVPKISSLPAKHNSYITLGCFNNPTKINGELILNWATLLRKMEGAKLFLKGRPYTSSEFCERLYAAFETHGIGRDRLIIEGPGSNYELLNAYNRVDIALDSWPYSGGLTTCEALLMGVPVVTLPGPTFAGRHSASHLTHAGMPELITYSWEEYHARVLELARDVESLGTIRQHLRDVLLQSPLCDGPRFARHFSSAMRAIWQRYCDNKPPAALAFTQDGQPQFDGEPDPVTLQTPPPLPAEEDEFNWTFTGKVVAIDNGARHLKHSTVQQLLKLQSLEMIAFDPAGEFNSDPATKVEGVHYYAGVLLGSGESKTLHACLDPSQSATLLPLDNNWLPDSLRSANKVLAQLPVNSLALDSIGGLPTLDWLVLDARHNASVILENGSNALKDTLLLDISIAFQPTHEHQPSLAELQHWASRNGFRFYRLERLGHRSHLPEDVPAEKRQATELESANALFLPSHERMAKLSDNQRTKLAFLLHTIYGIKDMAYALLSEVDEEKAEEYLIEEGVVEDTTQEAPAVGTPEPSAVEMLETPEHEAQEFPLPEAPFMSPAERNLFKKGLKNAKHYFEFGSGGSTVWAVKEGLTVKGVESDTKWVNALKDELGDKCQVEAVDIGPTKEWGFPVSMQVSDRFSAYSQAIAQHSQPFDFILVDGRFRVACTMSAILHVLDHSDTISDARIFIHDFWNRLHYHVVLQFLETVEKVETAGLFKLSKNVSREEVVAVWEQYAKQPQ